MTVQPNEIFPELLRNYRNSMGWTQKEMAKKWGYSVATIAAWEEGKRKPRTQQFPELAERLEIEVKTLMQSINGTSIQKERKRSAGIISTSKGQNGLIKVFQNQKACEEEIRAVALQAKKVKVLTIRGDKYFSGSNSLLYDLCTSQRTDFTLQVLLLSPEAERPDNQSAAELHYTASKIARMRLVLGHLQIYKLNNQNIEVRYYKEEPNFKMLVFDDILFVSAFVTEKNDKNTAMLKMRRAGNPLFEGLERDFDRLWRHAIDP